MATTTTMRTLLFGVRTSRRSSSVLMRTLRVYTTAAGILLDSAQRRWPTVLRESLYQDRLSPLTLEKTLRARFGQRIDMRRYPLHSSLREALFSDVSAALASYHALAQDYEKKKARLLAKAQQKGLATNPPDAKVTRLLDDLGDAPSWPTVPRVRPDYDAYNRLLDEARSSLPGDDPLRLRLSQALAHGTRPLFFPRADGGVRHRNCGLLRTAGKTIVTTDPAAPGAKHRHQRLQYRALLYVLPTGDQRARPLAVPPTPDWEPLIPVQPLPEGGDRARAEQLQKTGLERSPRPSPALLLPLECSTWHEETVEEAVRHPEMVRAARLVHRPARTMAGGRRIPEKFFLAVTFAHPVAPALPIQTYLGISMDEEARVGWCLRALSDGRTLAAGVYEDLWGLQTGWRARRRAAMRLGKLPPRQHHRQREQVKHAVHDVADRLLTLAQQYGAQMAVNDVRYLRLRKPFRPRDPVTGKRLPPDETWREEQAELAYKRACLVVGDLERVLSYKGQRLGLPAPLSIGGISPRDCAACGQRSDETLLCSHCGALLDAQNSAAVTASRVPAILEKMRAARAKRKKEREQQNENGDQGE